ncbi:MAG: foldase protein PrsA [Armatimonadota bacterium]
MKRVHSLLILCTGLLIGFLGGAMVTVVYSEQAKYNYSQVVARAGETLVTRDQLAETMILKGGNKVLDGELRYSASVEELARRAGVTVTADELSKRLEECYKTYDILGKRKAIDSMPLPLLHEQMHITMLAEKILKLTISDREAEVYFQEQRSQFYKPALYKLILISASTEADAASIIKRLKKGESARALAKLFNVDDRLKAAEGDIGWVARTSMGPAVADAIFEANDGKGLRAKNFTTPIIQKNEETGGADYLIFYVDNYQADYAPPFEEVHPAATFLARGVKVATQFKTYFDQHKSEVEWKRVKDLFDPKAQLEPTTTVTPPPATQ